MSCLLETLFLCQVRGLVTMASAGFPKAITITLLVIGFIVLIYLWFEAFLGWVLYRYATKPMSPEKRAKLSTEHVPEKTRQYYQSMQDVKEKLLSGDHQKLEIVRDGLKLRGIFIPATNRLRDNETMRGGCAILVHGWQDENQVRMLDAKSYLDRGISVFLPWLRAHGQSEGKRIDIGCKHYDDLFAWVEKIDKEMGEKAPLWYTLDGLSMGAATVLTASGSDHIPDKIIAIIADCGYTSLVDQGKWMIRTMSPLLRGPAIFFAKVFFFILQGYKLHDPTPLSNIAKSKHPIFIIHGSEDLFVPTWMSKKLIDACSSTVKDYWVVEGAQHALSAFVAGAEYAERKHAFIEKALAFQSKT